MMRRPFAPLALALLALAACGPGQNDPAPGGVTVGEAKALDDAAAMLDQQRSPIDAASAVPSGAATPPASAKP
jgi:hypothetical protein